ncbi:hypothetical protein ACLOJK_014881, partial [Asimina triloba]
PALLQLHIATARSRPGSPLSPIRPCISFYRRMVWNLKFQRASDGGGCRPLPFEYYFALYVVVGKMKVPRKKRPWALVVGCLLAHMIVVGRPELLCASGSVGWKLDGKWAAAGGLCWFVRVIAAGQMLLGSDGAGGLPNQIDLGADGSELARRIGCLWLSLEFGHDGLPTMVGMLLVGVTRVHNCLVLPDLRWMAGRTALMVRVVGGREASGSGRRRWAGRSERTKLVAGFSRRWLMVGDGAAGARRRQQWLPALVKVMEHHIGAPAVHCKLCTCNV